MNYIESVLDNKWYEISKKIESIAAKKIVERLDKKKKEVIENINKS